MTLVQALTLFGMLPIFCWLHAGRLVGCTRQAAEHGDSGTWALVSCRESRGQDRLPMRYAVSLRLLGVCLQHLNSYSFLICACHVADRYAAVLSSAQRLHSIDGWGYLPCSIHSPSHPVTIINTSVTHLIVPTDELLEQERNRMGPVAGTSSCSRHWCWGLCGLGSS